MYVDAIIHKNMIHVVERDSEGNRVYKEAPIDYKFYVESNRGSYTSIFGTKVEKLSFNSFQAYKKELSRYAVNNIRTFETDVDRISDYLSNNYDPDRPPQLRVAFVDIETDFNKQLGFAPPEDPFNKITSIGIHDTAIGTTICLAIKPDTMSEVEAQTIVDKVDNAILCHSESEMLQIFLELIEPVDIISGWNSEGFDIPYLVNRVIRILGKNETRKFCLWGQYPTVREYERYGKSQETYDLIGRIHLDYLQLYQKYTYNELQSFSLDNVSYVELGEKKVAYAGTLDTLYHNDFEKFLRYNIQDVDLLVRLDHKLQYIDQANLISHANGVRLPDALGSVKQIDQAIINEAHHRGMVVPTRDRKKSNGTVAGAYVASPKVGMHQFVGAIDLNSLYPSILRAMNMSPETLIGQIRHTFTEPMVASFKKVVDAWEGRFACIEYEMVMAKDKETILYVDFENGETVEATGAEIHAMIFQNEVNWGLTANGTLFTYDTDGIIPSLLERWYAERKQLQYKAKFFAKLENGISVTCDDIITTTENEHLVDLDVKTFETKFDSLNRTLLEKWGLSVKDGKLIANNNDHRKYAESFWDKRQLVKKILLNSLYGGLLNEGSRFFDARLGQSTTLTGRTIARHMSAQTNYLLSGVYDHTGECIIYGDTDSVVGSTLVSTDTGKVSIEDLFNQCSIKWNKGEKEYACDDRRKTLSFDPRTDSVMMKPFNYVYRHKTKKVLWRITDEHGTIIDITEDHSVMVERNGVLIEAKPSEIKPDDILIKVIPNVTRVKIAKIEQLGEYDDYVYDIGIDDDTPYFFGNDILVHNSVYFSAYPVLKKGIESGEIQVTIDDIIEMYDSVAEGVNETFVHYMAENHHAPAHKGKIIAAGREVVASKGLFIKKKRYALMVVDNEGKRMDVNGEAGKIKAMGLELKRSDTPIYMQDFLKKLLKSVLTDGTKDDAVKLVKEFRTEFQKMPVWEKGTPKRVNKLTYYYNLEFEEKNGNIVCKKNTNMPWQVRASINYNILRKLSGDLHSMAIMDGMKTIVFKLKKNKFGFTRIALPIDETRIPEFLKTLPYDVENMEYTIITKKVHNLLWAMGWDLRDSLTSTTKKKLF